MYNFFAIITVLSLFSASSFAESEKPSDCDVLAAHPSDPDKIADGVGGDVMLVPAVAACKDAVSKDPNNRRLRYQLGRVLFYSGQTQDAWQRVCGMAGKTLAAAKIQRPLRPCSFSQ